MLSLEEQFFLAVTRKNAEEVRQILDQNPQAIPGLLKYSEKYTKTSLHVVCLSRCDAILKILLNRCSEEDVNRQDAGGRTPFLLACFMGSTDCAVLLIKDPRTNLALRSNHGYTPLWMAAYYGYPKIIEEWIISGRDMNPHSQTRGLSPMNAATDEGNTKICELFEKYNRSRPAITHALRVQKGWHHRMASEVLAPVVFVSDGLLEGIIHPHFLRISERGEGPCGIKALRFFNIARRLPVELQMVLCYRVAGVRGTNIPCGLRERAFRDLAGKFQH
jgi:ankyrin repeat protein